MRILLDECLPRRLARSLPGHTVSSARQMDWLGLTNGRLLTAANLHFDVLLTVDKNLVRQQDLRGLQIAVIVLRVRRNRIEDIQPLVPQVLARLSSIQPGSVAVVP